MSNHVTPTEPSPSRTPPARPRSVSSALAVPTDPAAYGLISDDPIYATCKRAFDVGFSLVFLVLASPVWLAAAVLIRVTSPGPVLFRQARCGEGGRRFTCYKFRTMVANAEEWEGELESLNEVNGPVFKIRDDPRVTLVGRWLRKSSIDELPNLLNVLKGDMSLVGPRPPLPKEVARYRPKDRLRLAVKPGVTCLWQVSGRSEIQFDEWVRLDLEYIRRRSFWFDMQILLRTVPAVLTGRGAA